MKGGQRWRGARGEHDGFAEGAAPALTTLHPPSPSPPSTHLATRPAPGRPPRRTIPALGRDVPERRPPSPSTAWKRGLPQAGDCRTTWWHGAGEGRGGGIRRAGGRGTPGGRRDGAAGPQLALHRGRDRKSVV